MLKPIKSLGLCLLLSLTLPAWVAAQSSVPAQPVFTTTLVVTNLLPINTPVVLTTNQVVTTNVLVPINQPGAFPASIANIFGAIDESTNLFAAREVEVRIGGVYVQKTGEGGTVLALEKWDLFTANVGVGLESVTSGQDQAAEFAWVGYRKTLGNVAGLLFVGGGYNEIDREPMGVVGGRIEYRTSKHLGLWTSTSFGIETKQKQSRGMVIGGGVSYAF